jgi:hypothetical protein
MVAAPAGLCHGFMVERWRDDLAPLAPWLPVGTEVRERLLERVGEYLAFRAGAFAAADGSGATAAQLHAMGRHNTAEALGAEAAATWDAWQPALDDLGARMQRVETDNRLHAWEWLVGSDAVLKADALDHHAGHDLVGCQDIAWDVVGAAVELGLSQAGRGAAGGAGGGATRPAADPDLRCVPAALLPGLQLGYWSEARSAATVDEAARIGRLVERLCAGPDEDLAPGRHRARRPRRPGDPQGLTVSLFCTDFTPSMPLAPWSARVMLACVSAVPLRLTTPLLGVDVDLQALDVGVGEQRRLHLGRDGGVAAASPALLMAEEALVMADAVADEALCTVAVAEGLGETVVVVAVPAGVVVVVVFFSQATRNRPATRTAAMGVRRGEIRDMSFSF